MYAGPGALRDQQRMPCDSALIDADHAVLLTGYTTTDITYIDPDDGGSHTVGMSTMASQTESSGNVFIGYIR